MKVWRCLFIFVSGATRIWGNYHENHQGGDLAEGRDLKADKNLVDPQTFESSLVLKHLPMGQIIFGQFVNVMMLTDRQIPWPNPVFSLLRNWS